MEYTKIAFFDKDTQTMSAFYPVEVGHEGSFVYDKTTDTAKLSIYTDTKPEIQVNQWAFLAHFTTNADSTLTYDANGLPINHEQYTVAKYEKQIRKNSKWLTQIALQEPIEITRGILTETLSFTNQTEKVVKESGVDVTYTRNKYNCYTALQRVLMVTPANNDLQNSWLTRINILDSSFLAGIDFQDDTFSAGDLFTILFKLDDIIDRTPVIYFDMVNTARQQYILKFERKDGYHKTLLDYDDLIADNIGLTESDTTDTYATGVMSEANNLATNNIINFPSANMWGVPKYDSEERDVPNNTDKGKFYIEMPMNIKKINLIKKLSIYGREYRDFGLNRVFDITRNGFDETVDSKYILEKQNYLASDLLTTNKDDLYWFEEGTNKLYVNSYFYKKFDYNAHIYYVEFEPLIDAAIKYGTDDYLVAVNQTDSQVESLKYTRFLNNYLKGMNKADIIFTKVYYNFADFADLVGSRVDKDGEEYIISNVSYKNANQLYVVAFQLNKSNLRRSANVRANQQIKANKAIDYENLKDRRSIYFDNIKIDKTAITAPSNFLGNKLIALSALVPSTINSALCPQVALMQSTGVLTKNGTPTVYTDEFLFNFAKIVNKGQIQYAIKTQDNAQIGTKKIPYSEVDLDVNRYGSFGNIKEQIPVIYTNPFGEIQYINYIFSTIDEEAFNDITLSGELVTDPRYQSEYLRTLNMYNTMANLPIIPAEYRTEILQNEVFSIYDINKYKDMLEIENDSIVFDFTSDNKDIIVCQRMLELSRLISSSDTHTLKVWLFAENQAEFDTLSGGVYNGITATSTSDSEKITISFTAGGTVENIKSIVIGTDSGEKLLIINNPDLTQLGSGYINIYY